MFRLIQIDPESLAIHLNALALKQHPNSKYFFNILDSIYEEGFNSVLKNNSTRKKHGLVDFLGSYLHELRHYADLILTPYGSYRLNTAFEVYFNFSSFTFPGKEVKTPIPFSSGWDEINREILDIKGHENQFEFYFHNTLLSRSNIITQNNVQNSQGEKIELPSGDKILEALAFIQQFDMTINEFDIDSLINYKKKYPHYFSNYKGNSFDRIYRWFLPYVHEIHKNEITPNNRLIFIILFASLCGNITLSDNSIKSLKEKHRNKNSSVYKDVTELLPESRFIKLFEYFRKKNIPSLDYDIEAYTLVDEACIHLFGNSILQELKINLDTNINFINKFQQLIHKDDIFGNSAINAYKDILNCKKKLLNIVNKNPLNILSIFTFYKDFSAHLKPSIIYNYPTGPLKLFNIEKEFSKIRKNWIVLIDHDFNSQNKTSNINYLNCYSFWSPLAGENNHHAGFDKSIIDEKNNIKDKKILGRQYLYAFFAPFYKQFLYSKQYYTMNEAEGAFLFQAFDPENKIFAIDPFYNYYKSVSRPDSFFHFLGKKKMRCDVCNEIVTRKNSYIVSAGTLRQSKKLHNHFKEIHHPEDFKRLLIVDWSPWLLCENDMTKFSIPI